MSMDCQSDEEEVEVERDPLRRLFCGDGWRDAGAFLGAMCDRVLRPGLDVFWNDMPHIRDTLRFVAQMRPDREWPHAHVAQLYAITVILGIFPGAWAKLAPDRPTMGQAMPGYARSLLSIASGTLIQWPLMHLARLDMAMALSCGVELRPMTHERLAAATQPGDARFGRGVLVISGTLGPRPRPGTLGRRRKIDSQCTPRQ